MSLVAGEGRTTSRSWMLTKYRTDDKGEADAWMEGDGVTTVDEE